MLPYRFDYAALRVGLIFVAFGSLRDSGVIDDKQDAAGFIDDAVRGMAHDGFGMNLPPAAHPSLSKERRQLVSSLSRFSIMRSSQLAGALGAAVFRDIRGSFLKRSFGFREIHDLICRPHRSRPSLLASSRLACRAAFPRSPLFIRSMAWSPMWPRCSSWTMSS